MKKKNVKDNENNKNEVLNYLVLNSRNFNKKERENYRKSINELYKSTGKKLI